MTKGREPWFAAPRERVARWLAPWLYDTLTEAVTLAGSLPLSVPATRYDDLLRLDELHTRLGVMPPRAAGSHSGPDA